MPTTASSAVRGNISGAVVKRFALPTFGNLPPQGNPMAADSNFKLPAVKMGSSRHAQMSMVEIRAFAESRQTLGNNAGSLPRKY